MERFHIQIYGNVIGVGFRNFLKYHASRLGIKGYVRNTNKEVEAVLEGSIESVKKLLELCTKGPFKSKVIGMDIKKEAFKNEFTGFDVRY